MCEMGDSAGTIAAYAYSQMSTGLDHETSCRTWLYDYLDKFGFFENKGIQFNDEILQIFHWLMEEQNQEPKLTDIQTEYMSGLHDEIEEIGQSLNCSAQEIFDTYDRYYVKYDYSIEDRIKDVLDANGLSPLYLTAPQDVCALIKQHFGDQTFFPDILNHLVRRRAN